jgi:hypothetical protein
MRDIDNGVIVTLDGELVLAALLRPEELARRVAGVEMAVERQALARADVADIVAGAFQAGRTRTPAERAHVACLLLWLATRDPAVADRARRGGIDLAWHVATPWADGERWQLALHITDRADHTDRETHAPPAWPTPAELH